MKKHRQTDLSDFSNGLLTLAGTQSLSNEDAAAIWGAPVGIIESEGFALAPN